MAALYHNWLGLEDFSPASWTVSPFAQGLIMI
jgi:hypothetical protein